MPAPYEKYNDYTTHGMPQRELKNRLKQHYKMAKFAKGKVIAAEKRLKMSGTGLLQGDDLFNPYGMYKRDYYDRLQQFNMWEGGKNKLSNESRRRRTLNNLNNPNYRSTPKWKRGK
tara:strand:+ start:16 stop:363 length:348 start_codon:yes stop_codon:yes gene_type:complete